MSFWDTTAGVLAMSAARASLRVAELTALGFKAGDPPFDGARRQLEARTITLKSQLATQLERPDDDDLELAAQSSVSADSVPSPQAERSVAVAIVLSLDALEDAAGSDP